jgi:hypothetical protein
VYCVVVFYAVSHTQFFKQTQHGGKPMTTIITMHEVEDGERWAKAWHPGPGSRHEMVAKLGWTARTFRDPQNPNWTGIILEVPDLTQFLAIAQSDEMKKSAEEDGAKLDTLRILVELTP